MTVLRSRVVPKVQSQSTHKTLKKGEIEPATPVKALEPSSHQSPSTPNSSPLSETPYLKGFGPDSISSSGTIRRRSLRLASKSNSNLIVENVSVSNRKRYSRAAESSMDFDSESDYGNVKNESVVEQDRVLDWEAKKVRVSDQDCKAIRVSGELGVVIEGEQAEFKVDSVSRDLGNSGSTGSSSRWSNRIQSVTERKGKRKLGPNIDSLVSELWVEDEGGKGFLSLRSGMKIAKMEEINGDDGGALVGVGSDDGEKSVHKNEGEREWERERETGNLKGRRKSSRGEKGKGKLVNESLVSNIVDTVDLDLKTEAEISIGLGVSDTVRLLDAKKELKYQNADGSGNSVETRRRLSREEKGKEKVVGDGLSSDGIDGVNLELRLQTQNLMGDVISSSISLEDNVALQSERHVIETDTTIEKNHRRRRYKERKERCRDIARKNASRFAHFSSHEEEENYGTDEAEGEMPVRELDREIEDWPGPFSTAMKIIKDREMNMNVQQQNVSLDKSKSEPVIWSRRKDHQRECSKPLVPSLQELCMRILAKNADAITSLDCVPDVLRHKLSHLLCDSRRMNIHFLDLLVRGSPTEVRVRDCSWLTEEQFTRTFEMCDTNYLTVLQLDQCGRCMPDYILCDTLARSFNSLPALTTISLKGACRLSDAGLTALVSSAPALRSINLGQCSLLTSSGINILPDSLGSALRELYLDDCQSIDPMHILPALKKLEHLEVLSLAGIQTVCDDFIRKFVIARGLTMKELVLANCVNLTDSSLKVIAETCPGLCSLDLMNLCKLTDSSIGYLANGCREIQILKLCRNAFSDEAIAAFLETSGEFLKELSLNNVNKVGHNTAISLARCSKQLVSLDLSWCRNIADEAVGLIVDSCLSLKLLKLFGCTQITKVFLDGHSNPEVQMVGLKMTPLLEHLNVPDFLQGPLRYSPMSSV
ncbi:uncharacterized protein LOC132277052 [Cornus florida]|uniref:uncharacterized protein LOC132277052 n=1 Tax=Cornus florida TaxID=4283 RepID=UPI00289AA3A1|nr:uncharacterized protein LOC132277052 [Cornus florida]